MIKIVGFLLTDICKRSNLLTVIMVLILGHLCSAQTFEKVKLDQYFNQLETHNKFMGSVVVSKGGVILYSRSIGFEDFENKVRASQNSKYRIGSISKTFTTVLILKAVEKKKLNLDQTIDKYFPTIKNADKISIRHLLTHRSGIHNFTDDADYGSWYKEAKTEKEMLNIIQRAGIDFEPDSKADYSNSNFVLLSYILEKTFEKPYPKILHQYIVKPLGLKSTYFGGKINPERNECKSYGFAGTWELESETDMSIPLGAGGIVSTPSDLVRFSEALFSGKLLKSEMIEKMKTMIDDYGMGLFQIPFYNHKGFGHTGGIDGFMSVFSYFPDGGISYALTSNGANYNVNNVSIAVLSAVFNKPYDIPDFTSYPVKSEDLHVYLGVYSSKQIPLKITVTKNNHTLMAQATGQSAFPLEATEKDKFRYEQAGVVMEFNPAEKTMTLKQGGGTLVFSKE